MPQTTFPSVLPVPFPNGKANDRRDDRTPMPKLGAHMSVSGGFHTAAERAAAVGCETVQLFVQTPRQWTVADDGADRRPDCVTDEDAERFRAAVETAGLSLPCAHASYLINLAAGDRNLRTRSIAAFAVELQRAERLGLAGVVVHPGTATGCSEQEGLDNVAEALERTFATSQTTTIPIWLETTAGQGASLGHRFEHIAELIDRSTFRDRLGVCLDTCHVFAAGYPLGTDDDYAATLDAFDRVIGLNRLCALHLNDSKKPLASRVDRHEHIGEGCLGIEPFRHVMNDPRLHELPMYLETPKGLRDGRDLDTVNLERLRELVRTRRPSRQRRDRRKR
jgi:deoxyribonuclease-4